MPNSVLVPVDGSNFAEHALPYALGIARRTGATLHLALVHVPTEVSPSYPLAEAIEARDAELRDQDTSYMDELVDRLRPSGVEIRPSLLRGYVSASLSRHVEEEEIGLVVMTTHGRGGLQRAWLGSTADSMMRHCRIPLLLLRPAEGTREIGPTSDRPVRTILAALDGTEMGEVALRDACEIGITEGARVILVHVLHPPVAASSPYLPHTIQLTHDEIAAREAHIRRYLNGVATREWLEGRPCEARVLVDYHPAPAILELAEEVDADLIVVGTHGRGGLPRLILGSVADKVIRGTHRPVLVHRGVGSLARLVRNGMRAEPSEQAASPAQR